MTRWPSVSAIPLSSATREMSTISFGIFAAGGATRSTGRCPGQQGGLRAIFRQQAQASAIVATEV